MHIAIFILAFINLRINVADVLGEIQVRYEACHASAKIMETIIYVFQQVVLAQKRG